MSDNTEESKEVKSNEEVSAEDTQKIINAVASDIIKTTNLFQAFELVKQRAFDWASNHVNEKMPMEEKLEILSKVAEAEAEASNSSDETQNPEEGAVIS